jgi:hypothetical protein
MKWVPIIALDAAHGFFPDQLSLDAAMIFRPLGKELGDNISWSSLAAPARTCAGSSSVTPSGCTGISRAGLGDVAGYGIR